MIKEKDTLGIENNIVTRMRRMFSWEETPEDIALDHKLVDLFSRLRCWEEKNSPCLSNRFESRVLEHLKEISMEEPSWREKFIPSFIENRPVQYGLSFAMATLLAVVLISRGQGTVSESIAESTGVIIDNTSYLDRPSSVEYADSFHRRVFLDSIREDANSSDVLRKLEAYYRATGKNGVASEIRFFIDEVSQ
jgi:hypothetical protein